MKNTSDPSSCKCSSIFFIYFYGNHFSSPTHSFSHPISYCFSFYYMVPIRFFPLTHNSNCLFCSSCCLVLNGSIFAIFAASSNLFCSFYNYFFNRKNQKNQTILVWTILISHIFSFLIFLFLREKQAMLDSKGESKERSK